MKQECIERKREIERERNDGWICLWAEARKPIYPLLLYRSPWLKHGWADGWMDE